VPGRATQRRRDTVPLHDGDAPVAEAPEQRERLERAQARVDRDRIERRRSRLAARRPRLRAQVEHAAERDLRQRFALVPAAQLGSVAVGEPELVAQVAHTRVGTAGGLHREVRAAGGAPQGRRERAGIGHGTAEDAHLQVPPGAISRLPAVEHRRARDRPGANPPERHRQSAVQRTARELGFPDVQLGPGGGAHRSSRRRRPAPRAHVGVERESAGHRRAANPDVHPLLVPGAELLRTPAGVRELHLGAAREDRRKRRGAAVLHLGEPGGLERAAAPGRFGLRERRSRLLRGGYGRRDAGKRERVTLPAGAGAGRVRLGDRFDPAGRDLLVAAQETQGRSGQEPVARACVEVQPVRGRVAHPAGRAALRGRRRGERGGCEDQGLCRRDHHRVPAGWQPRQAGVAKLKPGLPAWVVCVAEWQRRQSFWAKSVA